jgi:hypothetical protein
MVLMQEEHEVFALAVLEVHAVGVARAAIKAVARHLSQCSSSSTTMACTLVT